MHRAHHDVARLGLKNRILAAKDLGRTDHMAIDVRLEYAYLAHRAHAILEHAAVVAEPQPDRPALIVFRPRDDLVQAFLGEERGPAFELVVVDGVYVLHHEPRYHF